MIISASRRTDIPCCCSDWFFNRLKEGFLYVRNPVNPRQVSKVSLSPELVDCIVFWTKNPIPMLRRLDELKGYAYYFQFTLTGYGADLEPGLPSKREELIPAFRELAQMLGSERVIWRYDPIFIGGGYTAEYHTKAFEEIARQLRGCTEQAVISFGDLYEKTKRNTKDFPIEPPDEPTISYLAERFSTAAKENGMRLVTCAEQADLSAYGIGHGSCIDAELAGRICGAKLECPAERSQGQGRKDCGCAESVDIGAYDTCRLGCRYCYANADTEAVRRRAEAYNSDSPILCDELRETDHVTERRMKSRKSAQISMF